MISVTEKINKLLAEWNPIGVDQNIVYEEYRGYIPRIVNAISNENELRSCLESIAKELDIGFNKDNGMHIMDLDFLAKKIMECSK